MKQPLTGIRVLDLTQGICGPFCTQILSDLGAEVLKIEPPSGDSSRSMGTVLGATSIPYISLNRGKKSVVLDLNDPAHVRQLLSLAEGADLFVEDLGPHKADRLGVDFTQVKEHKPDMLYISINGYGSSGRFCSYSDADGIVQALSGIMSITGEVGGPFTKAGIPLADLFTGLYASIASLAGLLYRAKTGRGLHAEAAKLSVLLSAMPDALSKYLNTGQTTRPKGTRHQLVGFFQPVDTADGSVICMAAQQRQFQALTQLLDLPQLQTDPRFDSMFRRGEHASELEAIIQSRTRQMATGELTHRLLERKIPAGPIYSIGQMLDDTYTREQNLVISLRSRGTPPFRAVGFPLRFSQFPTPDASFVSQRGEYTRQVLAGLGGPALSPAPGGKATPQGGTQGEAPLSGIRILDLTLFMAGPLGTEILQNLGAEVIKIERLNTVSDFSRTTEPTFGTTSAYFIALNGGKQSVALDLKSERHRDLLLSLAERCDIAAENFRPGVTGRLRIGYDELRARNPRLIYSSVSGFGQRGSYRERGCVDTVAQGMSGLMHLTGSTGGPPVRVGSSVADVCASLYEAVGILAALIYRDREGVGGFIDAPMLSSMLSVMGDAAAEYLNCGSVWEAMGNEDRYRPLLRCLPVKDGHVMIDLTADQAIPALAQILNLPHLSGDSRFITQQDRCAHLKELEQLLLPRTSERTMTQLAEACRDWGIGAGEVFTLEQICRSGYLEEQHLVKQVFDREEGWFQVIGSPLRFDAFELPSKDRVPQPGEHTAPVLRRLLGLDDQAIAGLFDR